MLVRGNDAPGGTLVPDPVHQLELDRRAFLKLGAAGTVALAAAGLGATLAGCGSREHAAAHGYRFLRDADLRLLSALLPAVLAGLPLGPEVAQRVLQAIDQMLLRASAESRKNVYALYDLLHFGPTRWLAAGVREPWHEATAAQVEAFLVRWRDSRVGLFNVGYGALTRIIAAAHFAQPAGYEAVGYRPLPRVYDALNG